jgi:hypothetical protein
VAAVEKAGNSRSEWMQQNRNSTADERQWTQIKNPDEKLGRGNSLVFHPFLHLRESESICG